METIIKQGHCAFCKTEISQVLNSGPHVKTGVRFCLNCGKQIWTICKCEANLRYEDRYCSICNRENPIYLGDDPGYYADSV